MNKFLSLVFGLLFFLFSCSSIDKSETTSVKKENPSVFPVTEFLKGQLNIIESTPITLLKLVVKNDVVVDSVWISRESIRGFATPFLTPEIDSGSLSAYFDGESFLDQTVNSFTFTYAANSSLPKDIDLRNINIYINPDDGTITKVYLLKESYIGKITTKVQLTWQTDKWCSIRTIIQKDNENPVIKEDKVIWNFD